MKKRVALKVWFCFFLICHGIMAQSFNDKDVKQQIVFTENKGQVHDQNYQPRPDVLYCTMAGNMVVHIKKTGVSYQLYRVDQYNEIEDPKTKVKRKKIALQTIYRVDLNWINANTNIKSSEDETLPGYNNYYLVGCPDGALNVRSYKGVTLYNLYKGIKLHYYESDGELKHDYIIAPHADYKQIKIRAQGAEITVNKDGSLLLSTQLGIIQEGAPIVYQNGKQLRSRWKKEGDVLSFVVEGCDPNYELIIDPVTRLWGTYYSANSSGQDFATTCVKINGFVYMGGTTTSSSEMATVGTHQVNIGGSGDAFLVKFNDNGVRQWGTYYGGSGVDESFSCAVDSSGNVFLTGETTSTNSGVIATPGAHKLTISGNFDSFLVKFNSNGVRLWGTYYGGSGFDYALSCATDGSGNVFISGYTSSYQGTGIATPGSHQPTYGGNSNIDGFLAKFSANGVRLWGTYYGGPNSDFAGACITDGFGNVYLSGTGGTYANTIIATPGSFQPVGGGWDDAFLAKFNGNGVRQWATYFGGGGGEAAGACALDASGNIFLAGRTQSNGSTIATPGSYQISNAGGWDGFLVKFTPAGIRVWSTLFGSTGFEIISECKADPGGNIYITGMTSSSLNPISTIGSHQTIYGGGTYDGFLAEFDANGSIQWSTYYGGAGEDIAHSCAVDGLGHIYVVGETAYSTGTVIATPGSHKSIYGGGVSDAFLVCFDACNTLSLSSISPGVICGSATHTFYLALVNGASSYTWSLPAGWSGSSNSNTISATPGSSGVFSVVAGNACGASVQQTLSVTVNPLPTITASSSSSILCEGESATLTASGALTYTFNPGGTGTSIVVTPPITSIYTVSGTDANGCSNTFIFTQNVDACLSINSNSVVTSSRVEMYPNPTEGKIHLELSSFCELTLMNNLGQIIYEAKLKNGLHEIDLENFAKGLYVLKVKSGKDLVTIKVIKE